MNISKSRKRKILLSFAYQGITVFLIFVIVAMIFLLSTHRIGYNAIREGQLRSVRERFGIITDNLGDVVRNTLDRRDDLRSEADRPLSLRLLTEEGRVLLQLRRSGRSETVDLHRIIQLMSELELYLYNADTGSVVSREPFPSMKWFSRAVYDFAILDTREEQIEYRDPGWLSMGRIQARDLTDSLHSNSLLLEQDLILIHWDSDGVFAPDFNRPVYFTTSLLTIALGGGLCILIMFLGYRFQINREQRQMDLNMMVEYQKFHMDGIIRCDLQSRKMISWNQRAVELLQLDLPENPSGYQHVPVAVDAIPSCRISMNNNQFPSIDSFIRSIQLHSETQRTKGLILSDSRQQYLEIEFLPSLMEIQRAYLIIRDIRSELDLIGEYRETRERLQLALTASDNGFFDWDNQNRRLFISRKLYGIRNISGSSPPTSLSQLLEAVYAEDRSKIWQNYESLLLGEQTLTSHEFRIAAVDGSTRWVEETLSSLRSDDGSCRRIIGLDRDITQIKEREEELNTARLSAEEYSRSKSEFLANMSHEIRTPMNAILGFTELLLREIENPAQYQYLSTVYASGRQLLEMLDNILSLSKIEAGRMPVEWQDFNLSALMQELEMEFRHKAAQKGLGLNIASMIHPGTLLSCDREKLVMILRRIIDNSIKFTEEGDVAIRFYHPSDPGMLGIEVQDAGIGMDETTMEVMTAPFRQAEGGTVRKYGGPGLGLSIATRLVSLLQGSLSAQIPENGGTIIDIKVPVEYAGERRLDEPPGSLPNESEMAEALQAFSVLCVDDSESNQLLLSSIMKNFQIPHRISGSPLKALEDYGDFQPDILLMDVNMPRMSGWECLQELNERYPREMAFTKVIMLSGDDPRDHTSQREMFSVEGFLMKPFSRQSLLQVLYQNMPHRSLVQTADYDFSSGQSSHPQDRTGGEIGNSDLREEQHTNDIDKPLPETEIPVDRLKAMIQEVEPSFKNAQNKMSIQEILTFADELRTVFALYPDSRAYNLAGELKKAVDAFDIAGMKSDLQRFEQWMAAFMQQGDHRNE
ncbi:ATP-binding response regulator [Salinispira pacifica]|uniref:histidine kinase n=1 Tax=Salinispira pacifica TaxID=1307761 RepID=V5WKA5_9SPIO|nr:PAS domain-containing hybrid sensor histidine kinase/response regulator [Salinispira pacifica]AHC15616.1 Sensor histidine kinase/response regulator [Salinispira pacifica]